MPTATKSDKIDLSSENKTEELANKISKKLKPGDVVFLHGEMGVGKTTFIKYLINCLQKEKKIKLTEITSPTFNLLNEYEINKIKINNNDLFRLKTSEEVKNLDLFVTVSNSTAQFAGALGVPTILICPKKSSTYYYWDYEDGKTPWYNSVSIIKFNNSLNYTMKLVDDLIDKI